MSTTTLTSMRAAMTMPTGMTTRTPTRMPKGGGTRIRMTTRPPAARTTTTTTQNREPFGSWSAR
ncbi:hypothetical protein GCM10009777_26270 [Microbacterium pumilum]|uniref:Uncharacterized protein n=1 Tax=Microbacterium pumilum TaxID=344165 RepID=A0ABP5E3W8_9MICO